MMKKQQGLTLIEIMIALALGLFIIAATLTVYINTIQSSSDTIKSARLNYDLGMAMSLMINDIRRAGFWSGAVISSNTLLSNPFSAAATTDISIGNNINTDDCILYTYDADSDGIVDANEYYGFRRYLNSATGTHTIQMRSSNVTCNATGTWASITDENMVNITKLQFSFAPLGTLTATSRCFNSADGTITNALICNPVPTTGEKFAQKRVVNIELTAKLVNDTDVTKTLEDTVKVRNNRVFTQP